MSKQAVWWIGGIVAVVVILGALLYFNNGMLTSSRALPAPTGEKFSDECTKLTDECLRNCTTDECRKQCVIKEKECQCTAAADECLRNCTTGKCRAECVAEEKRCKEKITPAPVPAETDMPAYDF